MIATMLPIGALLSGTALLLLGSGLLSTLIVLRGSLEGFSELTLGIIGSTYFFGFFLGTLIAPRLIRRMGHIRAFAFFGATVAVCILLHALIIHPLIWMPLRTLTGLALVGFYAVIESWLNKQTEAEQRGKVFGLYMAIHLLALAGAQQLLRIDSPASFTLFAVAAIFACLSLLPMTMTRLPQPVVSDSPRFSPRMIWRAAPAAFIGAICSGLAMGAFWSLSPLYGERIGLDANGVAMLMSCAILGGALLQWPMGRLSDKIDRRAALAAIAALSSLAAITLTTLTTDTLSMLAGFFIFGGAAFTVYPMVIAHLIDHLPQEDILAGNTAVLFLNGVGSACGPLLAGYLLEQLGPVGLPLHFCLAFVPLALFAGLQLSQGDDEIVDDAAQFSPILRTSPAVLDMVSPDVWLPYTWCHVAAEDLPPLRYRPRQRPVVEEEEVSSLAGDAADAAAAGIPEAEAEAFAAAPEEAQQDDSEAGHGEEELQPAAPQAAGEELPLSAAADASAAAADSRSES